MPFLTFVPCFDTVASCFPLRSLIPLVAFAPFAAFVPLTLVAAFAPVRALMPLSDRRNRVIPLTAAKNGTTSRMSSQLFWRYSLLSVWIPCLTARSRMKYARMSCSALIRRSYWAGSSVTKNSRYRTATSATTMSGSICSSRRWRRWTVVDLLSHSSSSCNRCLILMLVWYRSSFLCPGPKE